MSKRNNIIKKLFYEAESYKNIGDLEQLFETDVDLRSIPIQPLYLLMKSSSIDTRAQVLAKLDPKQRQALYDLEGWTRDELDFNAFNELPLTVVKSNDLNVIGEFANSDLFLLFLKGYFTIQTFDAEEANYPDNDSFFVTDDNAFIIEYNEDCEIVKEVQYLIKNLYGKLGVNAAYNLLMDLINQSYTILLEEQYQNKKERLRDYGFVDSFEAAELTASFRNIKQIDSFIENKSLKIAALTSLSRSQALHSKSLKGLVDDMEEFSAELEKINSETKLDFLQFDFIRLINSTLAANDALKKGSLTFTKINKETKIYLKLGLEYVSSKTQTTEQSLFENFTFIDFYKIGKSLIKTEQNTINKLRKTLNEDFENFMGQTLVDTIDVISEDTTRLGKNLTEYYSWQKKSLFMHKVVLFVKQFYITLNELKDSGKLNDNFYVNYNVSDIDFESLLMSSFINFCNGSLKDESQRKMGVSYDELKKWAKNNLSKVETDYKVSDNKKLIKLVSSFKESFGFAEVDYFEDYLYELIEFHLTGYDYDSLSYDDYKHIGGPIILNMN